MHRRRVFDRIEFALRFNRFTHFVVFSDRDSFNPRHKLSFLDDEKPKDKMANLTRLPTRRATPASGWSHRSKLITKRSRQETRSASRDNPASSIQCFQLSDGAA